MNPPKPSTHPPSFSGPAKEQLCLKIGERENVLKISICTYSFIFITFNNKIYWGGTCPPKGKKKCQVQGQGNFKVNVNEKVNVMKTRPEVSEADPQRNKSNSNI